MGSREAKYHIVMDWITQEIAEGRLKPGDRLISEEKLCQKFGLCRQTVRRATSELVKEDILSRLQGSGTYVGTKLKNQKKEKHRNVFVICTFHDSYIFPSILKGIERILSKAGYTMQVAFTDNRVTNETVILKNIIRNDSIDGLIMEPSESIHSNPNLKYFKKLQERNIPILFFNDFYPFLDAPCVRMDDYEVVKHATDFLIHNGHKKIGSIFKLEDGQGRRRYKGYLDALHQAGLKDHRKSEVWVDTCALSELSKIEEYLFYRLNGCSAVVCYNDEVAVQMIDMAVKRGIQVPEELSIVGIDDSDVSKICKIPVTSLPHPKEALGIKAAENMLQMIDNPYFDGNYLFEADIINRSSVTERLGYYGKGIDL